MGVLPQGYQLSEYEGQVFLPAIVEHSGHNQARMLLAYHIMQQHHGLSVAGITGDCVANPDKYACQRPANRTVK